MTRTTNSARQLEEELRRTLGQLRALQDEIRLEAHLAGMEARQRWTEELEPLLHRAELAVEEAQATARQEVNELVAHWRRFYELLLSQRPQHPGPEHVAQVNARLGRKGGA